MVILSVNASYIKCLQSVIFSVITLQLEQVLAPMAFTFKLKHMFALIMSIGINRKELLTLIFMIITLNSKSMLTVALLLIFDFKQLFTIILSIFNFFNQILAIWRIFIHP
uniref:Uncharacterized protein n=1 Tax=Opuntia streptacantha TaxID=393608 RepID=A0A7C9D924_OPUST